MTRAYKYPDRYRSPLLWIGLSIGLALATAAISYIAPILGFTQSAAIEGHWPFSVYRSSSLNAVDEAVMFRFEPTGLSYSTPPFHGCDTTNYCSPWMPSATFPAWLDSGPGIPAGDTRCAYILYGPHAARGFPLVNWASICLNSDTREGIYRRYNP